MGCCFSSTATTTSKTNQKNQNPPKPHNSPLKPPILQSHKTPSPPPPPEEEEEETVIKEVLVLSETPTLDKKQQEKNTQTSLTIPPKTQTEDSSPIKKQQQQQQHEQETSDLSQLSEIYSIAETISTTPTTTTATATKGLKEDEATSKENSEVKNKSPAKVIKKRPSNGDPGSVRARRVDPSPEKKAQCRGRGSRELRTVQRNVGSRSRSPGTGRACGVGKGAFGKSPTTVTGKTDSKPVGAVTVEGQGKREEDGKGDVMEQQLGTESLENPLVSLECFIFL
ncbi:hypothetical protein QQP08_008724 [Theobroma cacao]|nr:hypothetical protein QQP08_008724 [Theobroma cacao]